MVNYNPKNWLTLIFALHKSDTLRMLWKEISYMGIFTLIIAFIQIHFFPESTHLEKLIAVYSLVGFVISLLLVFRTNTAYDRWWEGRRKWGELVNDSRNLAVKLNASIQEDVDKAYFHRMICNFILAMKEHLRNGVILDELTLTIEEKNELANSKHIPTTLVSWMYLRLEQLKQTDKLSPENFFVIDKNLNGFLDACGAC